MNRLERLYAINEVIRRRSPTPVSAAALAAQFGVSRRTIERDLDALRNVGLPLYADRGRHGGHRTLEDPKKVIVSLSVDEVAALVIALSASGSGQPFGEAGRLAVDRLMEVLPDATQVGVSRLRSRIRTSLTSETATGRRVRRTLERGVKDGRIVNLDYVDRHGRSTSRSVDPVGFLDGSNGWALIGWCHDRSAGRLFRLDRITSARLTSRSAAIRDVDDVLGEVPFETSTP